VPLNLDRLRRILPDLDELRPFWDFAVERSLPDRDRAWSGSGELGTLGSRRVQPGRLSSAAEELGEAEGRRLSGLYRILGRAVEHLDAGDVAAAVADLLEAAAGAEALERHDRAEAYALSAFDVASGLKDRRPASLALRRAARAARDRGLFSEAASRYRSAFQIARDSFDAQGAAEAAIGLGNVLEQEGAWDEAEEWYRKALATLEKVDGAQPERWHALLNLHITLRSRGRLEESEPWLERADAEAAAVGDSGARAYLSNARGQLRMASGDYAGAEKDLREALDAAGSAAATVVVQLNLAEVLLAQGRILDAMEEARDAERWAVVNGVLPRLPEVYRLLGRIAAADGNPEAFVFFERALEIIREGDLTALEEAMTLQAYGRTERRAGNEERARELEAEALACYQELGIQHPRRPWSDTFGRDGAEGGPVAEAEEDGGPAGATGLSEETSEETDDEG